MFARLRSFWRGVSKRSEMESDLDEEMRFHVEARAEQLVQSGVPRDEAMRRARIEFGGTENYQEECRESHGMRWLDDLKQDLRYGARSLRKSPGLMLVAVVTLALGIGSTSLLAGMVKQWILQSVAYPHADRLTVLWKVDTKKGWTSGVSVLDFEDWQARNQVFDSLSAWSETDFNVTGGEQPQRIHGARVSANFFRTIGALPAAGRDFTEGEDRPGADRVAIISYGLWRDRFQSRLENQTISLDGESYAIAGVMSEDFHFTGMGRSNIWLPLVCTEQERSDRANGWLSVIGRRKADVTAAGASAAMISLTRSLEQQYPDTNTNSGVLLRSLAEEIGRHVGNDGLYTGLVVAICIALIACSNLAGIFLARTLARSREMSVRLALGAKRGRLARQLLSENALLIPAAVALGLWMARLAASWISTAIPYENRGYLPNYGHVYLDTTTVACAVGVAGASVLLFSISAILEGYRLNLTNALKESGGGSSSGTRSQRLRQGLVIAQVVLAMIVIVPAGITAKSLAVLLRDSPGFRLDHLLMAETTLPLAKYSEPVSRRAFCDQLLERLRALPHVESATVSETVPFGHRANWVAFWIAGQPEPAPGEVPGTWTTAATPSYAATMGVTLLRGRFLSPEDAPDRLPVVVISETLAKRYLEHDDAIGHKLRLGRDAATWHTIVGIVKDTKIYNLADAPMNQAYTAFAQAPATSMTLVLRTRGEPMEAASALQRVVASLDKELPLSGLEPLQQRLDDEQAPLRIFTQFSGSFALLALFLAGIGIYGVMAFLVESRSREIGIRVACGADRSSILWLVLSGALRLVVLGLSVGLVGAWAVARLLMSTVPHVSAAELDVYAVSIGVLCAAVLAAGVVPVRRATRVDPIAVLRSE
jgi:putative ABC transport system permease protein